MSCFSVREKDHAVVTMVIIVAIKVHQQPRLDLVDQIDGSASATALGTKTHQQRP